MTNKHGAVGDSAGYKAIPVEEFYLLVTVAIDDYKATIKSAKNIPIPTWDNAVHPLEIAEEKLSRIWNLLSHLNAVASNAVVRKVYEELLPKVTEFHTEVMQDHDLYEIYVKLKNSAEFSHLNQAQQMIVENELRDFKLSGVHLAEDKRKEYKSLVQSLSESENNFSNNVLDATEAWSYYVAPDKEDEILGLPEHFLQYAQGLAQEQNKPGWLLNLEQSCYFAVMTYAQNRGLRKQFYTAYNTRASDQGPDAGKWDNTDLIDKILSIRQKLSMMLGFANYAEYSLVPKMANTVAQVKQFLLDMVAKAKPQAEKEFASLCQFAKQSGLSDQIQPWDLAFYSEAFKIKNYNISDEELRPYFPEPRVLTGLFKLVRQIYGIEIEEVANFERWHETVRMFKVIDRNNELRGHFYIDLYAREGKRGGAWMAECISRIKLNTQFLQHPIAFLNCNFNPPTAGKPGLLTHDDVLTLFHEFGHTIHHVLTKVDYFSVSGMNGVSWDAVELPSQFMENWCWEWDVLQDISENINTGEPLPRELYDRLLATKNYQSAMFLMRQLEFALFDLRIHENSSQDQGLSVQQILDSVRKQVSVVPIAEFNRFQNSFSHIFAGGYAAGYYSYLWAEVLSCDAFDKFREAGVFNPDVGEKFLTTILEQGGSRPAMELFVAFAGREPEVDALLRHHGIK